MTTAIDPPNRGQRWSSHAGDRNMPTTSNPSASNLSRLHAAIDQETLALTQFSPIEDLLDKAQQCNQRVPTEVESRRPDRAYIEWLKGDKVLALLSKHSKFPYLPESLKDRYLACRKKHEAQRPMFEEIQDVLQTKGIDGGPRYRPPSNGWDAPRTSSQQSSGFAPIQDADPLVSRFSKLRAQPPINPRLPYPVEDDAMRLSSALSSPTFSVSSSRRQSQDVSQQRPLGPRHMPGNGPPHPPKEAPPPIVTTQFPRAPSPVYSPARNIPAPASVNPPRMTVRSASTASARSVQSNPPQLVKYNGSYGQPTVPRPSSIPEKPRQALPRSNTISPQDLFQVFKAGYRVLVVDVRARELFDEGHIHAKNIVCIDPLGLRSGMSFDELLDTLVLSPDSERDLLEDVGQFELVVYHDETTTTDEFLYGSPRGVAPAQLRAFHDTLVEFNERSPLRLPPKLLVGGLNGWMDLVGPQALQTSNTLGIPASRRLPKPLRPTRRVSVANHNSSTEIQRRRREHMRQLTPDERKEFMQRNQDETISEPTLNDVPDAGSEQDQLSAETIRTYDDFFRRFPSIKQQSMTNARPSQQGITSMASGSMSSTNQSHSTVPELPAVPPPTAPRTSYGGVSDRGDMQGALTRQPGTPPPLYVSRIVANAYKLPRTGLKNFHSTCYMNATIQCLLGTTPLLAFFLNDGYKASVQKNTNGSEGILPEVFANLLRGLWRNVDSVVRPITLQKLGGRLRQDIFQDPCVQQDAKEYLDFLIGTLHDDLNINFQRSKLRTLTEDEEKTREAMPSWKASKIEWDRWQHNNQSPISHFFQGQHMSQLRCLACDQRSTKYEPFNSIELPISATATEVNLDECLREYTKEERLDEGEQWRCTRCKQLRQATKRITITRMPQILIITLKRFVNPDMHGNSHKIHTNVKFPLRHLDLGPFVKDCLPPIEGSSLPRLMAPYGSERAVPDLTVTPPFLYDAYAILKHYGRELTAGHYTALIRDKIKNVWVDFNDERVTNLDPLKPLPQLKDSYILFYERSRSHQ